MPSVLLNQIFEADKALRAAERELLDKDPDALTKLLADAVESARASDDETATMRLERLADLCAQVPGPLMADALIKILDHEEPTVRIAAGEALLDVAYDFYAEVARAVDRALDDKRTGPAMCELPFILAEVGEPGAVKQLKRFLQSESAEVAASAIEASVTLLDAEMLEPLRGLGADERLVTMVDFEDETTATVGELATAAVAELESLEDL